MRCNNCGYDNPAGLARCEKCNAPLSGSIVDPGLGDIQSTSQGPVAGTIKGQAAETDPWDCPQCGRPVIPGSGACNNCGYKFGNQSEQQTPQGQSNNQQMRKKGLDPKGTIDPYSKGFVLTPVKTEFDGDLPDVRIKANSDTIEVGRELLEPDNNTISSKQATFVNRNGKWYVKDESSHKTTFVYAGDYFEVQDGDIILMGNRKFIFSK